MARKVDWLPRDVFAALDMFVASTTSSTLIQTSKSHGNLLENQMVCIDCELLEGKCVRDLIFLIPVRLTLDPQLVLIVL